MTLLLILIIKTLDEITLKTMNENSILLKDLLEVKGRYKNQT